MASHPRRRAIALSAAFVSSLVVPVLPGATAGATGGPDPGFGSGGYIPSDPDGSPVYDTAIASQSDGSLIVGTVVGSPACTDSATLRFRRYTTTGTLDTGFGTGGTTSVCTTTTELADLRVDSQDRVLAAVTETVNDPLGGEATVTTVGRLTPDGVLDESFGPGGARQTPPPAAFTAFGLAVGPGDSVIVAGFTDADTANEDQADLHAALVRFDAEDGIDALFGDAGVYRSSSAGSMAFDAVVGSDGTIHMGASYGFTAGIPTGGLETVDSDGSGGSVLPIPSSLPVEAAMDGQGRVLVAGANIGPPASGRVIRVVTDPGPALDPTFSDDGVADLGDNSFVGSLGVDPQDRPVGSALFGISVTGAGDGGVTASTPLEPRAVDLFRLGTDGSLDPAVGTDGFLDSGLVDPGDPDRLSSVVQGAGGVILSGWRDTAAACGALSCGTPPVIGRLDLDLPGPTPPAPGPAPAPPQPTPPGPGCPTGPVRVDASNAAGVAVAMWACGLRLVGAMWRGEGVLMVLPPGFFACPTDRMPRPLNLRAEFGFFLLQASCGWQPAWVRTWFGRWLVWTPPR